METGLEQVKKLVLKDLPSASLLKTLGLEWLSQGIAQKILKHQRDVVFLHWIAVFFITMVSNVSLLLYTYYYTTSPIYFMLASVVYLISVVALLGRFIIAMHVCVHSPILKQPYTKFNNFIFSWLLSPYFGLGPETYYCHHVKVCTVFFSFSIQGVIHSIDASRWRQHARGSEFHNGLLPLQTLSLCTLLSYLFLPWRTTSVTLFLSQRSHGLYKDKFIFFSLDSLFVGILFQSFDRRITFYDCRLVLDFGNFLAIGSCYVPSSIQHYTFWNDEW